MSHCDFTHTCTEAQTILYNEDTRTKQGRAQLPDRRQRVPLMTYRSRTCPPPPPSSPQSSQTTAQRNSVARAFDVSSPTCPLFAFSCFGSHPTWPRIAPRLIVFTCTARWRPCPSGSSARCGCSTVGGENHVECSSNVPSNAGCASKLTGALDETADAFRSEFAGAEVMVTREGALLVRVSTRNAPSTECAKSPTCAWIALRGR